MLPGVDKMPVVASGGSYFLEQEEAIRRFLYHPPESIVPLLPGKLKTAD